MLLEALLSSACSDVPSCRSMLLPHAQTLPSSSRARLAATKISISHCHIMLIQR